MARRTTNLFEMLQSRRGGAPAASRIRSEPPVGWVERLRSWWREGAERRERRGRPTPNRIRVEHQILRYSLSAPALALLGFLTLGLGFGLGWWAGGVQGSAALSADGRGGSGQVPAAGGGPAPGPMTDASQAEPSTLGWPAAKQFAQLSQCCFALLSFSASQEQAAIRLAAWLRDQGVQDARVLRYDAEGTTTFHTLCYLPEGTDDTAKAARAAIAERLKSLPEPSFEPRFAAAVAKLDPDVYYKFDSSR